MMPITAAGPLFGTPVNWAESQPSSILTGPVSNFPNPVASPDNPGWQTGPVESKGMQSVSAADGASTASQVLSSAAPTSTHSPLSSASAAATPFSDVLTDAIGQVNALESQAKSSVEGLISGKGVDVHQAMIATEKAEMGFELVLSVRNKALAAYQQVVGMQF